MSLFTFQHIKYITLYCWRNICCVCRDRNVQWKCEVKDLSSSSTTLHVQHDLTGRRSSAADTLRLLRLEPAAVQTPQPLTASSERCNQLRVCVRDLRLSSGRSDDKSRCSRCNQRSAGGAGLQHAVPAQDGKSQQGGHSLPIREIKQDRGQSAAPISTRGHWTAAGPSSSSPSSSSSAQGQAGTRPGPGRHGGTELIRNQQRKKTH